MPRYIDADKLSEMIQAKSDTLIEGKEAFLYVAKWLELLPATDVAKEILTEIKQAFEKYGGQYGMKVKILELEQKYGLTDCTKCGYFVGCECFDGKVCGEFKDSGSEKP